MSGLLLYGDTERSPALRHEVPLAIIDSFLFAELDGRAIVLTSSLERDRIAAVLPQAEILDFFALGLKELVRDGLGCEEAAREVIARLLDRLEVREATVPGSFPVALADRLRAGGVALRIDDDAVEARRRAKAGPELAGIRQSSGRPRRAWPPRPSCSPGPSPVPGASWSSTVPRCRPDCRFRSISGPATSRPDAGRT